MEQCFNLNQISSFLKVAELQSYTKAAISLGTQKSTVSRSIALLEADIGVQLFYRTTRSIELTSAGKFLYSRCVESFDAIVDGVRQTSWQSNQVIGVLKITSVEDIGVAILTPKIAEFCELHPKVKIDLILTEKQLDLVEAGIDLAVRVGGSSPTSYRAQKLGMMGFLLASSPRFLHRYKEPPTLQDVQASDIIAFSGFDLGSKSLSLVRKSEKTKLKLHPKFQSTSTASILGLALAGKGIAMGID
jgi:DNA-binding transcriptional LysR family regulator